MGLEGFNAVDAGSARGELLTCCDVPWWADRLVEGRPYPDLAALLDAADEALGELTDADVDRALDAHPRIGDRATGQSATEQGAVRRDTKTLAALAEVNRRYEKRFDRVFLICATGLGADEILAAAERRLGNDDAGERAVVRDELRKIALLRLRKVVGG
ncbi:2-oxo-4-hydroxy-4-carboxy-5-ureidoimidazoline decarboxylase [Kribbella amoyensis]|uniref:2-oxo-4-hydroxy-4-carboxy-5-ureidoimidazoline decarboxylase n=1 Tax=Kribbella amoyensis TaxID=996641 RepID=A0A561B2Q3_9ACTN|nr:2-oxo-4-hydroxy-4-carboxy-5-ureidoimidazoline decarboxylase [Kribbella amoyensis]TWD73140.1 2-oxo-4-hydroxy-4-carboxy-5-ureidoimidazoline decarboxylase [Kribbella amoyensis]